MENKVPEIAISIKTTPALIYTIDDMINMFGDRIKDAIYEDNETIPGTIIKGIIFKEMRKLFRKYKTNKDIIEAYKKYQGYILVPWIIINDTSIIDGKAFSNKMCVNKENYSTL